MSEPVVTQIKVLHIGFGDDGSATVVYNKVGEDEAKTRKITAKSLSYMQSSVEKLKTAKPGDILQEVTQTIASKVDPSKTFEGVKAYLAAGEAYTTPTKTFGAGGGGYSKSTYTKDPNTEHNIAASVAVKGAIDILTAANSKAAPTVENLRATAIQLLNLVKEVATISKTGTTAMPTTTVAVAPTVTKTVTRVESVEDDMEF